MRRLSIKILMCTLPSFLYYPLSPFSSCLSALFLFVLFAVSFSEKNSHSFRHPSSPTHLFHLSLSYGQFQREITLQIDGWNSYPMQTIVLIEIDDYLHLQCNLTSDVVHMYILYVYNY